MSLFRQIELFEPQHPSLFFTTEISFTTSLFPNSLICFPHFDYTPQYIHTPDFFADLIDPLPTRIPMHLKSLCDRVSALELTAVKAKKAAEKAKNEAKVAKKFDRKYTWQTKIEGEEGGIDRKYNLEAEIKGGGKKNYKWTAEIKGKGKDSGISRVYTFKASSAPAKPKGDSGSGIGSGGGVTKANGDKNVANGGVGKAQIVEIGHEEENDSHGAVVLRQVFAKRARAVKNGKGKRKELSPQDAAYMIQMTFREYLIRRSQALRGLRELAIAKAKLKELRKLFNNFSYRRHIARDAEELQKFSERIIVLLLTVDAIEGADMMVRSAKRSMVDELEAMLDVVDPQPHGKFGSMRRRTFDLPDGGIQKEIAEGVAEVVQMLDQNERNGANTFEIGL